MRKVVYCSKLESLEGKGMLVKNERRGGAYQVSICEHLSWGSNTGNAPLSRYNSIQLFRENSLSIFVCKLQWSPETGVLMTFRFHHN